MPFQGVRCLIIPVWTTIDIQAVTNLLYRNCAAIMSGNAVTCRPLLAQHQFIVSAPSALFGLSQQAFFHEVSDVAIGGVLRAMVYFVPLRRVQFSVEAVEKHIEKLSLAVVQLDVGVLLPKAHFLRYAFRPLQREVQRGRERLEEPENPLCHVEGSLLRPLEIFVVRLPMV